MVSLTDPEPEPRPDSVEEGGIANDARGHEAALESIVAPEVDYVFFNPLKGLAMREVGVIFDWDHRKGSRKLAKTQW